MKKVDYINIEVICPRNDYTKYKMQIRIINSDKLSNFPLPCNGCDFMDGSDLCENCTASLTYMFFYNPNIDTNKPIRPDFSTLNKRPK